MKNFTRTLLASALALGLAGTAAAASQVTISGMIDTGLTFRSHDSGIGSSENSLQMTGGNLEANRVVIRGTEDLGNGTIVGFHLESGWNSDDGAMKTAGKLFDRGTWLWVEHNDWGKLAAGRTGLIRSGATPLNYFATGMRLNPFGTGWGNVAAPMYTMPFMEYLRDNTIHYRSPEFGGFRVYAQYAMGGGEGVQENKSNSDRYSAMAMTFDAENVELLAMVDWLNESTKTNLNGRDAHDTYSVMVGGNVTIPGDTKLYAWGQYFKDANTFFALPGSAAPFIWNNQNADQVDGYSLFLGAKIPTLGGKTNLGAMFMKAERDDNVADRMDDELKRYGLFAGYEYPLSKRTRLYAVASYWQDKIEKTDAFDDPSVTEVTLGIHHKF